ncbi:STAS domain-containing protein [Chloroflexota bacterium]
MEKEIEITTQQFKRCDLVSISGRIDSYTAPKLEEAIEEINDAGRYKIVLDLSGLEFMSSAGFRTMLLGQRNCKRYNRGEIVLASLPKRTKEALDLTGFLPLFKVFDDQVTAVGNF